VKVIQQAFLATVISIAQAWAQIPNATKIVIPAYPKLALAAGQQGIFKFELDLNPDGSVRRTNVIESFSKLPLVLAQIAKAISSWQFQPGSDPGQAITIEFKILSPEAKSEEEMVELASAGRILIKARAIRLEQNHAY
jgi:hypothetical protein